jgi:hypothetical protein
LSSLWSEGDCSAYSSFLCGSQEGLVQSTCPPWTWGIVFLDKRSVALQIGGTKLWKGWKKNTRKGLFLFWRSGWFGNT